MSDKPTSLNDALMGVTSETSEFRRKESELHRDRIDTQHEEMELRKEELEKSQSIDLGNISPERIKQLQADNTDYLEKAKNAKVFINDHFKGKIPYFPRNIILVAAATGDGKSTTSANLAAHALQQGQRVLVISNEEAITDVYNRVTCLFKGWSYANHEKFTTEQRTVFNKFIDLLSKRMAVVDDTFNGSIGQTSTLEGVEAILNSLIENKSKFDVIIIDYYQNIDRSTKNPKLKDWEVQGRVAKFIDKFKNSYDAPIVVLAQMKPNSDEKMSFKESIEGRKAILNVATCALQMLADRENQRTAFIIKKSRFPESMGETIYVGYKRGQYVLYDKGFKMEAQMMKEQRKTNEVLKKVSPS